MLSFSVLPDGFSFPLVLRACANLGDVGLSEIVHCHVVQMGFQYNVHVGNELLALYWKVGSVEVARRVFDKMVVRNIISWNSMVSGYAFCGDCDGAFGIFVGMESEGLEPNLVTWTSLLSSFARCGRGDELWELYDKMKRKGFGDSAELLAVVISMCADRNAFCKGKMVHDSVVKGGFENYTIVRNSLICMYGKNGALGEAEYLFSELEAKSIVSWNALISSYAESGFCDESYEKFLQLENSNGSPFVKPNVVSWSAVIGGFASKGRYEESLQLFRRMQLAKVVANSIAISSVMMACAELSVLRLGKEIHAHALRNLADWDMLVINGLINMYMKCGSLKEGKSVFYRTVRKDLITWNAMIAGFGFHGLGSNALSMFHDMIGEGFKPDECTFVSVLSACSHAGLVAQGRQYFDMMKREFSIEPQIEHYACIVDLLGRSGLLNEASDIIKSMPMEPNAYVFGALLNSCKIHKNTDVAEDTAAHIYSLGSETSGSIMLLSNLYAASGRWADSAKARLSAKEKGIKKLPGQSWIEVKKKVHIFSAGKSVNTGMEDIRTILDTLGLQMEIMDCTQRESFMLDTDNHKISIHNMHEECMLCELS
ncbi:hypothetical protein LIER_09495 [Lithospermum erythrorhizon]|uniref:Pentatricopeptide repeat-containing protein n=1 Tax=Lithospermum erythrorhizon TaxID=34254 RepID=A0AAV3PFZ8_LITER